MAEFISARFGSWTHPLRNPMDPLDRAPQIIKRCRVCDGVAMSTTIQVAGSLSSTEHPEMDKWAGTWFLVFHPLFDFKQTMVGPFNFLQYLLCVWIFFAMCASLRTFRSFDVLTHPQ
jgi:hypothetical protein